MAAREDQAKAIVLDRHLLLLVSRLHRRELFLDDLAPPEDLGLLDEPPCTPEPIDRPIPCRCRDPRPGVWWNTIPRPSLKRGDERVLDRFLGEIEVPERADEGRENPP
jgi:hypothetical protein